MTAELGLTCAVFVAVLGTALFLIRHAGKLTRIDVPDERRLHKTPTPRGGGLAMPFAVSAATAILYSIQGYKSREILLAVCAYALPNGLLGVVDDYRPLKSRWKFGIQILLATGFVFLVGRVQEISLPAIGMAHLGWFAAPFTVFWLVWSTNVYNFMDGMDGLAAGSGALFFGTLAALVWGSPMAAWVAVFGAAACLGFLTVNSPPAKIFMGDGGALFIGALLGACAVLFGMRIDLVRTTSTEGGMVSSVSVYHVAPFVACALAQGSFLWDATYTLFARILRREDWLHPHKRHLFQRLSTLGWTHDKVRRTYAALGVAGSAAALAMKYAHPYIGLFAFVAVLLLFTGFASFTESLEAKKTL